MSENDCLSLQKMISLQENAVIGYFTLEEPNFIRLPTKKFVSLLE